MPSRPIEAHDLAARRVAARSQLLDTLTKAAQEHGATAAHLLGSLGRQSADAFSDVDVWLTFPDALIEAVIERRHALYRAVGDLLLTHEAPSNRPVNGIYTLALYQTAAGPVQVDWYLAPQHASIVMPRGLPLFEEVPVPRGEWQLDLEATADPTCLERVNWLIAMLFIAVKKLMRGNDAPFLRFLDEAYRMVQDACGFGPMEVTHPTSLADVDQMLWQLAPYADEVQHRTLTAVSAFIRLFLAER